MTRRKSRSRERASCPPAPPEVESTLDLLDMARAGDAEAMGRLFARYMPRLKRWAHGRLPRWAREMRDTDDLVQESVLQTLKQVGRFQPTRDGAFHSYLKTALQHGLIDEVRRVARRPTAPLESDHVDDSPSPVEQVIGREALSRYEDALTRLRPDEREAVIARVELGCSYAEIAESIGRPSSEAARLVVSRALVRLAREMRRGA